MILAKKISKAITIITIFLGIIILVLGIGLTPINGYFGFLSAGGGFLVLLSIVNYALKFNKEVDSNSETGIVKEDKGEKAIKYLYKKVFFTEKAICMISKIPLDKEDEILQCPVCFSNFLENYLQRWVDENNTCPVCKKELRVDIEKKPM